MCFKINKHIFLTKTCFTFENRWTWYWPLLWISILIINIGLGYPSKRKTKTLLLSVISFLLVRKAYLHTTYTKFDLFSLYQHFLEKVRVYVVVILIYPFVRPSFGLTVTLSSSSNSYFILRSNQLIFWIMKIYVLVICNKFSEF